jgi:hypothetical protein
MLQATYRPTSPFYTDMMEKSTSSLENQEGTAAPDIPPKIKRSSQHSCNGSNIPPEFRQPLHNTTQDNINPSVS